MIRGLSQYRLLSALGAGGQGKVYLAFDTRLKRRVCIKLYHLSGSLSARRLAVKEARHLMRVDSPQTVDIYDVVSAGARLALVVQYIPGCTLEDLLAHRGALAAENAVALVTDLAAALAALRQEKIVHGDIKPGNVLINTYGRAVLGDFGSAQLVGEQWSAYSQESLSPEQSRGESAALSSDFFALGLLLYRMLFAEHPFYGQGELDTRRLRGGLQVVPALGGVSAEGASAIEALLMTLLASQPERRPPTTFELRELLRDVRSLLPAPTLKTIPRHSEPGSDARSLADAKLPRKLVRPPLWQQCKAWLYDYWGRGSVGARGLLVTIALTPIVVFILYLAQPGPCVAIAMPQVNVPAGTAALVFSERELRVRLSALFKAKASAAVVLGEGLASDSKYTLSAAGTHNACIAQRELNLQLDCDFGRCLMQLRGQRHAESQEYQLSVPQSASAKDLERALAQLVTQQSEFLMDESTGY